VSFFGCVGVSVLLGTRAELATRGARLEVAAASRVVLRTFSVTGMSDLLPTTRGRQWHPPGRRPS
jgi:anti-anti-sigma factor